MSFAFQRAIVLAVASIGFSVQTASAWQVMTRGPRPVSPRNGAVVVESQPVPPSQTPMPGQTGAKPADGSPADPNKPKEGEKKDGAAPLTARPAKPQAPPNPDELKNLKPDENGRVRFNLKGQPWPDVLEWLAETSQKSLDWQELPNDYLNLVTQQSYSIEDARDLLNRHLLSRGFTMITQGETISVVAVAKINPGMVRRVEPSELDKLPDNDFAKTSFSLDWLLADEAENELKPMLSPNGKLTHLSATNRLEAMDSVINLRQIWAVIQEEQSGGKQERLVREFKLKHTKAYDVLENLHIILGINKPTQKARRGSSGNGGGGGMDPNMMGQFQQQMQQMMQQVQQGMQQAQQAGAAGGAGGVKRKPGEIHLLANEKENSILANAPPDKMAIIAQAVKTLDVASENGENLLQNVQRMQVYRLSGIDPQSLIDLLDNVGNLDPTTKLQLDAKNKSIVAYASLADHLTIKMLVDKLDGSGRKFSVIPLRKLAADYVGGTIEFMMGGGEKEKTSSRNNPFYGYYDPYGGGRGGSSQTEGTDKFRVDADVENNRLLLWANDIEMREIENLLVKLGEIPPPGGNRNTQRVLDNLDPEDTDQLLEKIRRIWPGIAPNELLIDGAEPPRRSRQPADPDTTANPKKAPKVTTPKDDSANRSQKLESSQKPEVKTSEPKQKAVPPARDLKTDARRASPSERIAMQPRAREFLQLVAQREGSQISNLKSQISNPEHPEPQIKDQDEEVSDRDPSIKNQESKIENPDQAPPVRIRRGPDGRLILESQDTQALDQLEDLLRGAAPPRKDFKVFYLKYPSTWAYSVELNLKDFFKDEEKKSGSTFNPYWGRMMPNEEKDTSRRLSKKKPLKFISDSDSGTIIVQGADPAQLKIIEDLINIYDRPPSSDGKQVRKTQTFTLKYSKALVLAEAVKDVYRDLLSSTDKAYQNQQGKDGQKPPERNYTFVYGGASGGDDKKGQQETPVKFKGLISVGVDEISNTIIVSAPESLLENVAELVERLDQAARPTNTVQVVKVNSQVNSADLQKRLSKIFVKPPQRTQQQRPNQGQPHQQQPQENNEEPLVVP